MFPFFPSSPITHLPFASWSLATFLNTLSPSLCTFYSPCSLQTKTPNFNQTCRALQGFSHCSSASREFISANSSLNVLHDCPILCVGFAVLSVWNDLPMSICKNNPLGSSRPSSNATSPHGRPRCLATGSPSPYCVLCNSVVQALLSVMGQLAPSHRAWPTVCAQPVFVQLNFFSQPCSLVLGSTDCQLGSSSGLLSSS